MVRRSISLRAPGSPRVLNSEDLRGDCYAGKLQPTIPASGTETGGDGLAASDGGRFGGAMPLGGLLALILAGLRRRARRIP